MHLQCICMDLQFKTDLNFSKNYFLVKRKQMLLQKQSRSILTGLSFKLDFFGGKKIAERTKIFRNFLVIIYKSMHGLSTGLQQVTTKNVRFFYDFRG